jgi:hypothetical protein
MLRAIQVLGEERIRLQRELSAVEQALKALGGINSYGPGGRASSGKTAKRKGKPMSAATKAKIRASAKARWAKIKKG